jgi:hypothetical protein
MIYGQPRRRTSVVVLVTLFVALIGLRGESALLIIVGLVALAAYAFTGIRRRRIEDANDHLIPGPRVTPTRCVVVRSLPQVNDGRSIR